MGKEKLSVKADNLSHNKNPTNNINSRPTTDGIPERRLF